MTQTITPDATLEANINEVYDPQLTKKAPLIIHFYINGHYLQGVIDTGAAISVVNDDSEAINEMNLPPEQQAMAPEQLLRQQAVDVWQAVRQERGMAQPESA